MAYEVSSHIDEYASDPRFMQLDDFWAKKLRDRNPGCFDDVASLAGLLAPALEMVEAMEGCSTPCQKVRLWAEAMVEAIGLITMRLGGGSGSIGGPELPSLVLFLTCLNGTESLVAQASIHIYIYIYICIHIHTHVRAGLCRPCDPDYYTAVTLISSFLSDRCGWLVSFASIVMVKIKKHSGLTRLVYTPT